MDGACRWIGARIAWRIRGASRPVDVEFEGRIDNAESVGDGIVRFSGALASGARFVLVTNEEPVAAGP